MQSHTTDCTHLFELRSVLTHDCSLIVVVIPRPPVGAVTIQVAPHNPFLLLCLLLLMLLLRCYRWQLLGLKGLLFHGPLGALLLALPPQLLRLLLLA